MESMVSNKLNTLLIGEIHNDAESILRQNTNLSKIPNSEFSACSDDQTEVIVLRTFTKVNANDLDRFPKLKYIVSCSVGLNNLDLNEIKKRNISLIHTPGTNANSVAEHTLYLLYSLLRTSTPPFEELKGKTFGIIGFGAIGKLVAKKMLGTETNIVAFDVIEQDHDLLKELNTEMKSFDDILKCSDIITIHVPLNRHTENLINQEAFDKMKDGVFFINTSRNEVVDEETLLMNYDNDKFSGLGLDVCNEEVMQKLGSMDNVIITDHVAAQGKQSFRNMCLTPINKFLVELNK